MPVQVVSARALAADGRLAATIDLVEVGGGIQVVTVDGAPEERVHPQRSVFHVRLVSPDRMLPDQLHEVGDYDQACDLATRYADRLDEHAERVAALAADLTV